MEAVKERRDKCPKMIIYVNSITMCEMLYIWFHSELKKDAYIDEITIENRNLSRLSFTASIIQASSSSYFILKNSRKYLA
jgi:hypothetical protein